MAECMDCGARLYPDQFRRCGHCNARRLIRAHQARRMVPLVDRHGRPVGQDLLVLHAEGDGGQQPAEPPVAMSWPEVGAWAAASIAVASLVVAWMGGGR